MSVVSGGRFCLGLLTVIAVVIGLSSCDNYSDAHERLGLTAEENGAVMIHYLACRDEAVNVVRLYELNNNQTAPDDDRVIWDYEDRDATELLRDGVVPTTAGVPVQLESNKHYWVDVDTTSSLVGSFDFTLEEIEGGLVRSNGEMVSPSEFMDAANSSC